MVNGRELLGSLEMTALPSGLRQPGPLGRLKMNIYLRYKNCKKSGCCICQTETATARDLSGKYKNSQEGWCL
jgi:hypothetical protein